MPFLQATWGLFEMMLRSKWVSSMHLLLVLALCILFYAVYKTYDFPFTSTGLQGSPSVSNRVMSFSGYPASLVSGDDWFVRIT